MGIIGVWVFGVVEQGLDVNGIWKEWRGDF